MLGPLVSPLLCEMLCDAFQRTAHFDENVGEEEGMLTFAPHVEYVLFTYWRILFHFTLKHFTRNQ